MWSVDLNDCYVFQGHPQWTFIQADSIKDVEQIKKAIPEFLDLLFVDGDHTYEGCLADLRNYGPRAAQVFIHDTDAPDYPGVRKAVLTYCAESKRIGRFVGKSYGIGIVN